MNISLNWLATHLDLSGQSLADLDQLLTFAGVEVEGVRVQGIASERVVVAQIMDAVPHPHADRLKVTQVDAGEGNLRQIVCGATNYQVGDKVPCALPGAELAGGFTISETVMRKVPSRGMLCSATELGLPDAVNGLLILPAAATVGQPVKELFKSDVLLELEVTPNRPDLLSHRGMARELATLLERPLVPMPIPARTSTAATQIELAAPEACPFYSLVRIDGLRVQESPPWLKERLEAIGLRPINNIVDITNFVLHELGQPLHAFDAAQVTGPVIVRAAKAGESFVALDESEHVLAADDLVIADASGAVLALGGIMGGLASGVTAATTSILLESAYFTPSGIRRSSRRTGMGSDSSYRFERGVDPDGVLPASALALHWILKLAGGTAEPVTQVAGELPLLTGVVQLDAEKLDHLMGGSIDLAAAGRILCRLGLSEGPAGSWAVPSFRQDLQRHIDLVEEIARVHGLAQVPARCQAVFLPASDSDFAYDADMVMRRRLAALGFHECQTIKLVSEAQLEDALPLRPLQEGDVIRVKLPLSEDHAVMRPSIVPGLVASAARNVRHQAKSLRLFEMGRVFRNAGGGKAKDQESETLALMMTGIAVSAGWNQADRQADLYDLKGVLAAMLPNRCLRLLPKERDGFVLGCDIKADDQSIGVFARLRPARERDLDLDAPAWVAELDLGKLRKLILAATQVADLPQFPESSRDAAMDLPIGLPNSEIEAALARVADPMLVGFECFDVFSDPAGVQLAADRKSVAYRFHYRANDRTLKADEVDAAHRQVLAVLTEKLPVRFR